MGDEVMFKKPALSELLDVYFLVTTKRVFPVSNDFYELAKREKVRKHSF